MAQKPLFPFSLNRSKDTPPAETASKPQPEPIWTGKSTQDDPFTESVRPIVLSRKNFNKIFGIGYNKTGTNSLSYTLDLGDLGFFYRQYERLMAHWRHALPTWGCRESSRCRASST